MRFVKSIGEKRYVIVQSMPIVGIIHRAWFSLVWCITTTTTTTITVIVIIIIIIEVSPNCHHCDFCFSAQLYLQPLFSGTSKSNTSFFTISFMVFIDFPIILEPWTCNPSVHCTWVISYFLSTWSNNPSDMPLFFLFDEYVQVNLEWLLKGNDFYIIQYPCIWCHHCMLSLCLQFHSVAALSSPKLLETLFWLLTLRILTVNTATLVLMDHHFLTGFQKLHVWCLPDICSSCTFFLFYFYFSLFVIVVCSF